MASSEVFEVVLSGGAPWGFRLQGGKEFRAPLRIAKVSCNDLSFKFIFHVDILCANAFEANSSLVLQNKLLTLTRTFEVHYKQYYICTKAL